MMSNNLHIFLQLIVVGGWIVLFIYSFFRKRCYMTKVQMIVLFFTCITFSILNTAVFEIIPFRTDWWSITLYSSQISTQFLIAMMFNKNEAKTDSLNNMQLSLDNFIKISDNATRLINIMEYSTGKILYSNSEYKKEYSKYDMQNPNPNWTKNMIEEYWENIEKVYNAGGEVVNSELLTHNKEIKRFRQFLVISNGVESIITISDD